MKWAGLVQNNEWYIDEKLLIFNRKLRDPSRMAETDVRAYWKHWYNLAQSGKHFMFKRVGDYKPDEGGDSDGVKGMEDQEDDLARDPQQPGSKDTPRHCKSDKDKISFLHSLLPQHEHKYHSIIRTLASVEVGILALRVPLIH